MRRIPPHWIIGTHKFQSTHPHGVRLWSRRQIERIIRFQSTHPHGVRHGGICNSRNAFQISIHAPAWGATNRIKSPVLGSKNFNPRTRMGCDWQDGELIAEAKNFNPRTRMGCDASRRHCRLYRWHFNPRTRMGCDVAQMEWDALSPDISIHAPAWGATGMPMILIRLASFQSTHPHGVRLLRLIMSFSFLFISIHAPAWGATIPATIMSQASHDFNPRTRMGCDEGL